MDAQVSARRGGSQAWGAWALATLVAVSGCGGDGTPYDATLHTDASQDDATAVSVDLGTGQTYWEDIPASGAIDLIHGPQGGYHVFGRVRLHGFSPDVFVSFRVTPAAGGAIINTEEPLHRVDRRGLVQVGNGYESSAPELVILTQIHDPSQVVGMHFTLETTVRENVTGRTATTQRDILVQYTPSG